METFFALLESGRLVEGVLLVMLVELVALGLYLRGRAASLLDVLGNLLAGALLLLAVRSAILTGASGQTALFLLASFPAHLWDLRRRFSRRERSEGSSG